MIRFRVPVLVCAAFLALSACATGADKGLVAFNAGNYDEAHLDWFWRAEKGEASALHNMGVLWQQGLSNMTPRDPVRAAEYFQRAAQLGFVQSMVPLAEYQLGAGHRDAAISWLTLAARWGDQTATAALSNLGLSVPAADLAQAQAAQWQAQQDQANAILAASIACGVTGGCRPPTGAASIPVLDAPPSGQQQQRQCVYWTPQGQRVMLPVNGVCPARYGE